jgi:hypothetical protein
MSLVVSMKKMESHRPLTLSLFSVSKDYFDFHSLVRGRLDNDDHAFLFAAVKPSRGIIVQH